MPEQVMSYIGENAWTIAAAAGGAALFLLIFVLIQVTRTRREVHKICKKIRKYFEVVFSEDSQDGQQANEGNAAESEEIQVPEYQTSDNWQNRQEERRKNEEDAKLLIEVISEVF